jgi:tripartite-type tricarboxylate transporter receptor subunit TctC
VRVVVGQAAGSRSDAVARLIGQFLSERFGQQFVVENRPGAAGNIATEAVVRSPPDGYTLLLVNTSSAVDATLYDKLNFDFMRDIAPITGIATFEFVMEVNPSVPTKTLPEFIAYAKANPGKINMASAGIGSAHHLFGELFKMMAGVEMVHVPYRGSTPALTDLLGGRGAGYVRCHDVISSAYQFRQVTPACGHHGDALGITARYSDNRRFCPGLRSVMDWFWCAENTPAAVVDRLNNEINSAISDSSIKAHLVDLGGLVLPPSSPADFGKLIADETEKWAKVIRAANIKAE